MLNFVQYHAIFFKKKNSAMAAREEKCVSLIKLLLKSILKTKMIYHSTRCQEHNCQGVAEVLTG